MRSILFAAAMTLSAAQTALACTPKIILSPDHAIAARITPLGSACQEDRVEIIDGDRVMTAKSFGSADGNNGYALAKGRWTADSRYFVFDLTSSGGHSPLNYPTYVFDRKGGRLETFDAAVGDKAFVSGPGFSFKPHDKIELTLWSIPAQKQIKRTLALSAAAP